MRFSHIDSVRVWSVGLIVLLAAVVPRSAGAAGAGDIYFVAQRVPQAIKSEPGRPFGKALPSVDALCRVDPDGRGLKEIYHTEATIRGFSLSSDGTRIACSLVDRPGPFDQRSASAEVVVIRAVDGVVVNRVDTLRLGVRVFGSPVLLPDGKHLGLTVCDLPPGATLAASGSAANGGILPTPNTPPSIPKVPSFPQGRDGRGNPAANTSANPWELGRLEAQPFIATIDLDGKNLKRIAPGIEPCWSPDGGTILYTSYAFEPDLRKRIRPALRLYAMSASGVGGSGAAPAAHPVGPERSAAGVFSPDGRKIAYVANWDGAAGELCIADAGGASAQALKLDPALYVTPRWLPRAQTALDGARLQVVVYPEATKALQDIVARQVRKSVWTLVPDRAGFGGMRQVSPSLSDVHHNCSVDADLESLLWWLSMQPSGSSPTTSPAIGSGGRQAFPVPDSPDAVGPSDPPGAERLRNIPKPPSTTPQPIPPGMTVHSEGTRVFFHDAEGHEKPIPDGYWRLPNGFVIHVVAGQNTAR